MNIFKLITLVLVLNLFAGCEEAFDTKTDETYSDDDTWRIADKAKGVLYNAYAAMGGEIDSYDANFLDCATDNAVTNDYGSSVYKLAQGGMSPSNNPLDVWNSAYAQFKNIHLFLEKGLTDEIRYSLASDEVDLKYKTKYKGEALFLRAWWGWRLLQVYGGKTADGQALGYPIVLNSDEGYETKPRATYEQCVERIIKDLDEAITYLPVSYTGDDPITGESSKGKASGASSLALQAIVYLYAASDAYQPDGTTPDQRQAKWARAAIAADIAIRSSGIGTPKYLTAATFAGDKNTIDDEFLLAMSLGNNNSFEKRNFPPFYYGKATTNPSQNLADAFPTATGYPISHADSEYDATQPYSKRDPRFYLNIYHDGVSFQDGTIDLYFGGKDSYFTDQRASRTGYYLRKWIAEKVSLKPGGAVTAFHFSPLIRKTEVWLAFAEAANQAWGPKVSDPQVQGRTAYEVIKAIRAGAGIKNTAYLDEVAAEGTEAFDQLILNERRLELAFENQRYYDLRRRLMYDQMREAVTGVDIRKTESGTTYTPKQVEQRFFESDKYIYAPLPYAETVKNPSLIQNKGW